MVTSECECFRAFSVFLCKYHAPPLRSLLLDLLLLLGGLCLDQLLLVHAEHVG